MVRDLSWPVRHVVTGGTVEQLLTITAEGLFLVPSFVQGDLFHVHLLPREEVDIVQHTVRFLSHVCLDSKRSGLIKLAVVSVEMGGRRKFVSLLTFKALTGKIASTIVKAVLTNMKLDAYLGVPTTLSDLDCGMFVAVASPSEDSGRQSLILW